MNNSFRSLILLLVAIIFFAAMTVFGAGCFTRTVYVPHGQPVRLRQDVRSVKIWALDSEGKPVPGVLDLKEGWFCGPMKKDN